jgi:transposase-like protein DUF772
MTILVVALQHRFAGTSRSRHRARFISTPASAGGRSRTSPQSSHRVQKQRPIRNHQRLSALSDLRNTISRQSRCPVKSHRRPSAHRIPAGSFFGGFWTPALLPGPLLAPGRHPKPFPLAAIHSLAHQRLLICAILSVRFAKNLRSRRWSSGLFEDQLQPPCGFISHLSGRDRSQLLLLPEAVADYVGPDNPVRFIDAFVDGLDLAAASFIHVEPKMTGRPGYAPADLLKLYIYGYLNRVRLSRRLEAETHRNIEVIWLLRHLKRNDRS